MKNHKAIIHAKRTFTDHWTSSNASCIRESSNKPISRLHKSLQKEVVQHRPNGSMVLKIPPRRFYIASLRKKKNKLLWYLKLSQTLRNAFRLSFSCSRINLFRWHNNHPCQILTKWSCNHDFGSCMWNDKQLSLMIKKKKEPPVFDLLACPSLIYYQND